MFGAQHSSLQWLCAGRLGKLGLAKWFTSQAQMLYAAEHDEVCKAGSTCCTCSLAQSRMHPAPSIFTPRSGPQVWVHQGFLAAYRSVASRLLALAEEVTAGASASSSTPRGVECICCYPEPASLYRCAGT